MARPGRSSGWQPDRSAGDDRDRVPVREAGLEVGAPGFLHTNVAPILEGGDRPVLYVGDFDWQGGQIEANTRRVLESIVGPLDWTRVALTAEQVAARPDIPVIQKEDRRYRPPRVHDAVEVEALGQGPVVALVRAALNELLPEPLDRVREREGAQREQVRHTLDAGDSRPMRPTEGESSMTVPRCNATTRAGGKCGQVAGWGCGDLVGVPGARCKLHGGMSPSGRKAGERHAAEQAVATFGLPRDVDPHRALREELSRTNGHVLWLADLIAGLESADGLKQFALGEGAMWERPSVWYQLYAAERAHLVKVSEAAIKAGIAEREVRIAEEQGQQIAKVIRGVLDDVGVIPTADLPGIVRRHLGLVTAADASLN
jgi:hypothetical protein